MRHSALVSGAHAKIVINMSGGMAEYSLTKRSLHAAVSYTHLVRLNTEVDAEICRGLLAVRSGAKQEGALVQIKGAIARETAAAFEPPEYPVGVRSFKPPEACAATNRECGGL